MELIEQLVGNLGIQEEQAKGGAGLLFQLAKDQLGEGNFAQIADCVPGMNSLLQAAPTEGGGGIMGGGGMMGALGDLATAALGEQASGMGGLLSLAGGFSKLDLSGDMIGQFLPIILSYVQSQGGDGVKGLLQQVLK